MGTGEWGTPGTLLCCHVGRVLGTTMGYDLRCLLGDRVKWQVVKDLT